MIRRKRVVCSWGAVKSVALGGGVSALLSINHTSGRLLRAGPSTLFLFTFTNLTAINHFNKLLLRVLLAIGLQFQPLFIHFETI